MGEFRPYALELSASRGASPDAAAASAAHFALVALYPEQQMKLDAAYRAWLAAIPDSSGKSEGIAVGETVAAKILPAGARPGLGRGSPILPIQRLAVSSRAAACFD